MSAALWTGQVNESVVGVSGALLGLRGLLRAATLLLGMLPFGDARVAFDKELFGGPRVDATVLKCAASKGCAVCVGVTREGWKGE